MSDQTSRSQAQPQAGAPQPAVLAGTKVVLLISRGPSQDPAPRYVGVPDVSSKSQGDALEAIQSAGLTARVFDEASDKVPHGHVIAQTPQFGQSALAEAEVVLLVSSGAPAQPTGYVALPNAVGMSEDDAVALVQAAGLTAQSVHDFSPTVPSGIVIDQIPNAASVSAPPKKSLMWLWILLAVIAVAAIAAGAYFYLNRTTAVPTVVGMTQEAAQADITAAGFKVGSVTTTQTVEKSEVGKVVAQDPAGGGQAKVNSAINIVVSGGQKLVTVPDVGGMSQAEAEASVKAAGLIPSVTKGNSADVAVGNVISQAPAASAEVPAGTNVGLIISEGPQFSTVPNVVGQTQSEAQATLTAAGLGFKAVSNYNASATKGDVYSQTPTNGTKVAPGTVVSVTVSKGPSPTPTTVSVPNVIGKTQAAATTTLEDAGFVVGVSEIASGTAGQVVGQAPAANTKEPKGATVSILVSTGGAP